MSSHRVYDAPMIVTIILSLVLIAVCSALVILLLRPKSDQTVSLLLKQQMDHLKENVDSSARLVHQQMSELTKELSERLQSTAKMMQDANRHVGDRLDNAAKVVGEVQNRLGKMDEATARVYEVGKDIARLQEILRAPKLRGSLGEMFLGDLLAQVLPKDRFELQYGFQNGQKVDAVIRSVQGLIAIDSKFPLENFTRILEVKTDEERKSFRKVFITDVRKHIDAIAEKYILPDEGTLDFALMYIPAENVYYEIMLKSDESEKDLLRYAQERRVFPVSPNSFYAYLQTIAIGLKGLQLESGIREVMDNVARLRRDFEAFGRDFSLVGSHLTHARGKFEDADKRFQRLGDKIESLALREPSAGAPDQPELRVLPEPSALKEAERG